MIHNTKIREMVGTESIHHQIQHQRIKWFGRLTRLPIHRPAQREYNTKLCGRKARGRPRKTWIKGVQETLSLYNTPPARTSRQTDTISLLPRRPDKQTLSLYNINPARTSRQTDTIVVQHQSCPHLPTNRHYRCTNPSCPHLPTNRHYRCTTPLLPTPPDKQTLSLYNTPPAQTFRRAGDKPLFLPATSQVVQAVDKVK